MIEFYSEIVGVDVICREVNYATYINIVLKQGLPNLSRLDGDTITMCDKELIFTKYEALEEWLEGLPVYAEIDVDDLFRTDKIKCLAYLNKKTSLKLKKHLSHSLTPQQIEKYFSGMKTYFTTSTRYFKELGNLLYSLNMSLTDIKEMEDVHQSIEPTAKKIW